METERFRGIDQLVEQTLRDSGPLPLAGVVDKLSQRGINKGQVRNALWRLKSRGRIGVRPTPGHPSYEVIG